MYTVSVPPAHWGDNEEERRDTRHPQQRMGAPETQADRLAEFWALYSAKPGPEAFSPGQIVRLDPRMAALSSLKQPIEGYPCLVLRTFPDRPCGFEEASLNLGTLEVAILYPATQHDGTATQTLACLDVNAKLFEPWPTV